MALALNETRIDTINNNNVLHTIIPTRYVVLLLGNELVLCGPIHKLLGWSDFLY